MSLLVSLSSSDGRSVGHNFPCSLSIGGVDTVKCKSDPPFSTIIFNKSSITYSFPLSEPLLAVATLDVEVVGDGTPVAALGTGLAGAIDGEAEGLAGIDEGGPEGLVTGLAGGAAGDGGPEGLAGDDEGGPEGLVTGLVGAEDGEPDGGLVGETGLVGAEGVAPADLGSLGCADLLFSFSEPPNKLPKKSLIILFKIALRIHLR